VGTEQTGWVKVLGQPWRSTRPEEVFAREGVGGLVIRKKERDSQNGGGGEKKREMHEKQTDQQKSQRKKKKKRCSGGRPGENTCRKKKRQFSTPAQKRGHQLRKGKEKKSTSHVLGGGRKWQGF